jgi:hypothetical protein
MNSVANTLTRSLSLPVLTSMLIALLMLSTFSYSAQQQNAPFLFPVDKNGKFGYIDAGGKIVIPLQFDSARDFHEGLALVTGGKQKIFIDAAGRMVIDVSRFDLVDDFSEGVAAVNVGQIRNGIGLIVNPGQWGYIDKSGKLSIPMKFTHAEDFSEGLAAVNLGDSDHGAFIDHSGKTIFEIPLDVTVGFHEGLAGVLLRGTIAYYDHGGRKIPISTQYGPKSSSFSEGLLPVEVKDKWGYVDHTGKIAIEPQFEDAGNFSEGLAPVKVRSEETTWCPPDESGSRAGFTMKWGYIDKHGKLVVAPQFESAEPFSEGLAAIHTCDHSFFIDKSGKTIIAGEFKYASSFSHGLARAELLVKSDWLSGYIDKSGKFVWGPTK